MKVLKDGYYIIGLSQVNKVNEVVGVVRSLISEKLIAKEIM